MCITSFVFLTPLFLLQPSDYAQFFREFGKNIKLGLVEDSANKKKLLSLVRFQTSSQPADKLTSLQEYVDRMKPKQKYIYYIAGESRAAVERSPFLERVLRRGYEVLFLVDPIDEYAIGSVQEFEDHKLASVTRENLKLGDDEQERESEKKLKEQYKPLCEFLKTLYGDKVSKVIVSNRITQSPAVLVTSQYGWSANMERIMVRFRARFFSFSLLVF